MYKAKDAQSHSCVKRFLIGTQLIKEYRSIVNSLIKTISDKILHKLHLTKGIRTLARPDTSPADTFPRTHPRQTVARWTLIQKTEARPDSNPIGQ